MDDYYPFLDSLIFMLRSIAGLRLVVVLQFVVLIAGGILGCGMVAVIRYELPERAGRFFEVGMILVAITFLLTFRVQLRPEATPPIAGATVKTVATHKTQP